MTPAVYRIAALLAVLLFSAPTSPAFAGKAQVDDPTGDVWGVAASENPEPGPAPEFVTNVDLLGATTGHTGSRVVLKVRYVELAPQDQGAVFPSWRIRTDEGTEFRATLNLSGDLVGAASLVKGKKNLSTKSYCGLRPFSDLEKGILGVRVGRACLGKPEWVNVAAVSQMCFFCEDLFYDFAGNPGGEKWTWSGRVRRD